MIIDLTNSVFAHMHGLTPSIIVIVNQGVHALPAILNPVEIVVAILHGPSSFGLGLCDFVEFIG